jgi:hypothetical protein
MVIDKEKGHFKLLKARVIAVVSKHDELGK